MLVSPPMVFNGAGFQLGQHRLLGDKRHQYENDIRIPFIMRGKLGSTAWCPRRMTSRGTNCCRLKFLSTQPLALLLTLCSVGRSQRARQQDRASHGHEH